MRLIFFGTSRFATFILQELVYSGMPPLLVITNPDSISIKTRLPSFSPVKSKALELGLAIFQPQNLKEPEVLLKIKDLKPDVGVLAAYGKIVPKALIDIFPKGILNVHPSLLPRWRGPTPIQSTILAGDEKTGVTIILIDEKVDHGPIIAQKELKILDDKIQVSNADFLTLHDALAKLGAKLLVEVLPKWLKAEISPTPQDDSQATFCHKFGFKDAKIDWSKPEIEIERMVRAFNPEPGTWTEMKTQEGKVKILKILNGKAVLDLKEFENRMTGEIFEYKGRALVKCGRGAFILERVQPEGRKPISGADFLHGYFKNKKSKTQFQIF